MPIRELIRAASDRMQVDFELSRKKFGSPVDIGTDRVNILKDFLAKYLPRSFGFGNGEIIDTYGNKSGQVDIILCNQYHPFTYNEEGLGLFLAEGVDWAIEVKSNLTTELKQGMLQVKRTKGLKKKPLKGDMAYSSSSVLHRNQIPCLLFGYQASSIGTLRDNIKHLALEMQLSNEEIPDAVVVLNQGIVFNISEENSFTIEVAGKKKYGIVGVELKEDTLFQVLIFLSEHMPRMIYQSPIISRYATFPMKAPTYFDQE